MKRSLLLSLGVAMVATVVGAGERAARVTLPMSFGPALVGQNDVVLPPALSPVPDPGYAPSAQYAPPAQYAPAPNMYPSPAPSGYVVTGAPVEIYQNVKYRAVRNIAPCAVPTIIQVPDPCNKDACCKTCVNVEVCVPPCEPHKVRVTRDGRNVRYDFGKYAVSVRSIGHHVVVHYED